MNKKIRIFFSRLVIATQLVQLLSPAIVLAADNMCNVNPGTCVTPEQWEKGWGDARKEENTGAVAKQDEWTNANDSAPEIIREAGESNDVNRSQKAADAGHAPSVNAAVSEREDNERKSQKMELRQENAVTRVEERQQRQEERRQTVVVPAPAPAEKLSDSFCNYCGGFWADPKGAGCQAQAVERTKNGQCGDASADAAATKPAVVGAQCLNANGMPCGEKGYGTVDIDDDGDKIADRSEVLASTTAPPPGQACPDGKQPIAGRCFRELPQAPEVEVEAPAAALGGAEGIAKIEPKLMPPTSVPLPTQRLKDDAEFPAAPTAAEKLEICRPGVPRLADGSCAETFKQETETVRVGGGKFGQEMTVTTTSYCSGNSAVTQSRRSDGVVSSSSTACEWGCSGGACRGPTAEEADVYRYSVLQNAIEREQIACRGRAGGDLRDVVQCTAAAAYDKAVNNLQPEELSPAQVEIFNQAGRSDTVRQAISDEKYDELADNALMISMAASETGEAVPLTEEQKAGLRRQADGYAEEVVNTGSLSAAGYNNLNADSKIWDKISNVSAEEAKRLADQQGWLGGVIANNLFCAVNNNYRAAGECGFQYQGARSDENIESAQGFWSFLVAGKSEQTLWDQGMIFGDPRSAGYQAREYEDKAAPACGVHIWQSSVTEEEKACLTGQSVAAKARIAEVDEQNVQMAALNIGSVALGFGGGAAAAGIKGAGLAAQAGRVVVGSGALSDAVIAVGMAEAMTAGDRAAAQAVGAMSRAEGISETERETWSGQAEDLTAQADEAYTQNVIYGALFAAVGNVAGEVGMPAVGKAVSETLGETPVGRLLFGSPRAAAGAAGEVAGDLANVTPFRDSRGNLWAPSGEGRPVKDILSGGLWTNEAAVFEVGADGSLGRVSTNVDQVLAGVDNGSLREGSMVAVVGRDGNPRLFRYGGDGNLTEWSPAGAAVGTVPELAGARVVTPDEVSAAGSQVRAVIDGDTPAVLGSRQPQVVVGPETVGLLPAEAEIAAAIDAIPVAPDTLFGRAARTVDDVGARLIEVPAAVGDAVGGAAAGIRNAAGNTAKAVGEAVDNVSEALPFGRKPVVDVVDLEGPMAPAAKSTKEAFPEAGSVEVVPKGGAEPYRVDYDPNNPQALDSLRPGDTVGDVNGQWWIRNDDGTWSLEKLGVGGGEGEGGLKPLPTMALPEGQAVGQGGQTGGIGGAISNLSREIDEGLSSGNFQQLGVRPELEEHFRFRGVPQNPVGVSEADAVKHVAGVDFVNPLSENMAFEVRQGGESVFLVPVLRENSANDWVLYTVDTNGNIRQADELTPDQLDVLEYRLSNRAQKGAQTEALDGVRITLTPSQASVANESGSLYRGTGNIFYHQVGENVVPAEIRVVPIKMVRRALDLSTALNPKPEELPEFPDSYFPIREAEMMQVISRSGDNEFRLASGARIGRDPGVDLIVSDLRVSRDHARITIADDGKVILESSGRNGTLVNGRQVDQRMVIIPGDTITFGRDTETFPSLRFVEVKDGQVVLKAESGNFQEGSSELPPPLPTPGAGIGGAVRDWAENVGLVKPKPVVSAVDPSRAAEEIAAELQPFFKGELSIGPRSTAGRIERGTTHAATVSFGEGEIPKALLVQSESSGLVTIKARPGEQLSGSEVREIIINLKQSHPDGFAVTRETQVSYGRVLREEGFIPDPSGRLTWSQETVSLLETSSAYRVGGQEETLTGETRLSVVDSNGKTVATVIYNPAGRKISGVVGVDDPRLVADAIKAVAEQLQAQSDFKGIFVSEGSVNISGEAMTRLKEAGFLTQSNGRGVYVPEIPKRTSGNKLVDGILTALGLAGLILQRGSQATLAEQEFAAEKPVTMLPESPDFQKPVCNVDLGTIQQYDEETVNGCFDDSVTVFDPEMSSETIEEIWDYPVDKLPKEEKTSEFTFEDESNVDDLPEQERSVEPVFVNFMPWLNQYENLPTWFEDQVAPQIDPNNLCSSYRECLEKFNTTAHPSRGIRFLETYAPADLVSIEQTSKIIKVFDLQGYDHYISQRAVTSLEKLFLAAQQQGINLVAAYDYRSYELQQALYSSIKSANPQFSVAPGGFSEHQSGLAVDIYVENEDGTLGSVPQWVRDNANQFGIVHPIDIDTPHYLVLDAYYSGLTSTMLQNGIDPNNYDNVTAVILGLGGLYHERAAELLIEESASFSPETPRKINFAPNGAKEISAAGGGGAGGAAGFGGTVNERRQDHQDDSQSQDGHSQVNDSQLIHDIFLANQTARNQKVAVAVMPNNNNTKSTLLSKIAGRTIEPKPITPISTQILTTVWNWLDVNSGRLGTNTNSSSAIEENTNIIGDWLSMAAPKVSAAGGGGAGGLAGAVDHAGQSHQNDSQKQNGHSQINSSKIAHSIFFDNHMASNQEVIVAANPNSSIGEELLSITAGKITDPSATRPIPMQISTAVWNWLDVNSGRLGTNTNSNSAIEGNGNTIDNWLSMLAPKAYAAEKGGARIIPLSMYRALAGPVLLKKAVAGLAENERTAEKIGEAALAVAAIVNSIPKTGTLSSNEAGYSAVSGTGGTAAGAVGKGIYRVTADPVAGIDLILPEKINVGVNGDGAVLIGVTEGKGKVKIVGGLEWYQKLLLPVGEWIKRRLAPPARAAEEGLGKSGESGGSGDWGGATMPLAVQLFIDENKNGKMDEGEQPAKLAGVKVNLVAETKTVSYKLTEGWNFVAFPLAPESVKTAAELIQDTALDGGYVTTVATWEQDKWMEFSQRGGQKFGQDFELQPGRAYFLNSHAESMWTLAGTPLPAEKQALQLRKGWNGVGISKEGTTAVQVMDDIQRTENREQRTVGGETADQAGRWDYGLWEVVVKRRYSAERHEIYGRDFPIKPEEGYFVHVNEDVILR